MYRRLLFSFILCVLMVLVVASCVRPATATNQVQEVTVTSYTPRTTTVTTTIPVSEIVDVYLSSGKTPNISAEELYQNINDNDSTNNFYVLDVRSYSDYTKGHIPGAVNIPWREVAKVDNMAKLPKDRQIVVYCYTGHTGSQITALLNVMGYDAVNLKFGMTSWTMDETVAPGRFNNSVDCKGYPIVTGP